MRIFEVRPTNSYVPRIRIINLVDILFILLLFLVATTTFRIESPSAVRMTLPEAKTAEALGQEKIDRLLVSVGPDETIYLDQERLSLEELQRRLRQARAGNPKLVLQFSADRQVSYGRVVAIVDAARAAGIQNITAFTKKSVKP